MDFSFPASELEAAFRDGKGFDGSSVEGFVRIEESDLDHQARSDDLPGPALDLPRLRRRHRWREAVMFGDILTPDGKPYDGDCRDVLKRALAGAEKEFGFDDFKSAPSSSSSSSPTTARPRPLDEGGYFFAGRHGEIRKEIQLLLKRMGIPSEYDHHEVAHGQHEIDLRFTNALDMADIGMLFRYMVKRVARMHGLYATFMPKPINGQNGSGMHVHQSLWKRRPEHLLRQAGTPTSLSDTAQRLHGRPDGPRPRDLGRLQPVGQFLQAPDRGLRGPGLHRLGPEEPLGLHPRPPLPARQGEGHPDRAALARPGLQHLPGLRRHAGRRPGRHPREA